MKRDTTVQSPKALTPPWCERCNRRCESVEEDYDGFMQRVVYTARCHGERERVVIDRHELEAGDHILRVSISAGVAFRAPRQLT